MVSGGLSSGGGNVPEPTPEQARKANEAIYGSASSIKATESALYGSPSAIASTQRALYGTPGQDDGLSGPASLPGMTTGTNYQRFNPITIVKKEGEPDAFSPQTLKTFAPQPQQRPLMTSAYAASMRNPIRQAQTRIAVNQSIAQERSDYVKRESDLRSPESQAYLVSQKQSWADPRVEEAARYARANQAQNQNVQAAFNAPYTRGQPIYSNDPSYLAAQQNQLQNQRVESAFKNPNASNPMSISLSGSSTPSTPTQQVFGPPSPPKSIQSITSPSSDKYTVLGSGYGRTPQQQQALDNAYRQDQTRAATGAGLSPRAAPKMSINYQGKGAYNQQIMGAIKAEEEGKKYTPQGSTPGYIYKRFGSISNATQGDPSTRLPSNTMPEIRQVAYTETRQLYSAAPSSGPLQSKIDSTLGVGPTFSQDATISAAFVPPTVDRAPATYTNAQPVRTQAQAILDSLTAPPIQSAPLTQTSGGRTSVSAPLVTSNPEPLGKPIIVSSTQGDKVIGYEKTYLPKISDYDAMDVFKKQETSIPSNAPASSFTPIQTKTEIIIPKDERYIASATKAFQETGKPIRIISSSPNEPAAIVKPDAGEYPSVVSGIVGRQVSSTYTKADGIATQFGPIDMRQGFWLSGGEEKMTPSESLRLAREQHTELRARGIPLSEDVIPVVQQTVTNIVSLPEDIVTSAYIAGQTRQRTGIVDETAAFAAQVSTGVVQTVPFVGQPVAGAMAGALGLDMADTATSRTVKFASKSSEAAQFIALPKFLEVGQYKVASLLAKEEAGGLATQKLAGSVGTGVFLSWVGLDAAMMTGSKTSTGETITLPRAIVRSGTGALTVLGLMGGMQEAGQRTRSVYNEVVYGKTRPAMQSFNNPFYTQVQVGTPKEPKSNTYKFSQQLPKLPSTQEIPVSQLRPKQYPIPEGYKVVASKEIPTGQTIPGSEARFGLRNKQGEVVSSVKVNQQEGQATLLSEWNTPDQFKGNQYGRTLMTKVAEPLLSSGRRIQINEGTQSGRANLNKVLTNIPEKFSPASEKLIANEYTPAPTGKSKTIIAREIPAQKPPSKAPAPIVEAFGLPFKNIITITRPDVGVSNVGSFMVGKMRVRPMQIFGGVPESLISAARGKGGLDVGFFGKVKGLKRYNIDETLTPEYGTSKVPEVVKSITEYYRPQDVPLLEVGKIAGKIGGMGYRRQVTESIETAAKDSRVEPYTQEILGATGETSAFAVKGSLSSKAQKSLSRPAGDADVMLFGGTTVGESYGIGNLVMERASSRVAQRVNEKAKQLGRQEKATAAEGMVTLKPKGQEADTLYDPHSYSYAIEAQKRKLEQGRDVFGVPSTFTTDSTGRMYSSEAMNLVEKGSATSNVERIVQGKQKKDLGDLAYKFLQASEEPYRGRNLWEKGGKQGIYEPKIKTQAEKGLEILRERSGMKSEEFRRLLKEGTNPFDMKPLEPIPTAKPRPLPSMFAPYGRASAGSFGSSGRYGLGSMGSKSPSSPSSPFSPSSPSQGPSGSSGGSPPSPPPSGGSESPSGSTSSGSSGGSSGSSSGSYSYSYSYTGAPYKFRPAIPFFPAAFPGGDRGGGSGGGGRKVQSGELFSVLGIPFQRKR